MKYYLVQSNVNVSGGGVGTKVSVMERDNHETLSFEFRANNQYVMAGDTYQFKALAEKHPTILTTMMQGGLTLPVLEQHLQSQGFQRFTS